MLSRVSRLPARIAARAAPATSTLSVRAKHNFTDKELAEEKVYFNKEEEKLLRRLLTKVKGQADKSDTTSSAASTSVEKQRLLAIVSKYGVSNDDIEALLAWRHSHDF